MDKLKNRYKIIPIDLSLAVIRPAEISIAGACAVKFVRFGMELENQMRYPQHFQHDFFQIAIDDSEHFFPFRPYDMFTVLPGASGRDCFHTLYYRNLRAISNGWAFLMVCYDICPAGIGNRQDITFPLKNCGEAETFAYRNYANAINTAAGAEETIVVQVVTPAFMLLIWDACVWQTFAEAAVDYEVRIRHPGDEFRMWLVPQKTKTDPNWSWSPARPMEIPNSGLLDLNVSISVVNRDAAQAAHFGGSWSTSLVPISFSHPAQEWRPGG